MTSEVLQKAREYEAHYSKFITPEERPAYHLTPYVGWMNDPNGFAFHNGRYHLFYQYHPYAKHWGPMHWGHVVSDDLLHWEYLPAAIAPDTDADRDGCFSGSSITLEDGRQLLLYTGVERKQNEDGTFREVQAQCIAIGDGIDYEKYEGNPVLGAKDIPAGFSHHDFRDPKIWKDEDGYYCVVGDRSDDGSGAILLFESKDALHWRFVTILDRCYNEYGKMWECPDFFRLGNQDVILTSPQDMSPLGLEFHTGNNSLALLGQYDPKTHQFERETVQAVDYGLDFYAPQTTLSPDGRRIMIGWMQNWDTCVADPRAKWFGQMTTPRELTIRDGRMLQSPIRELEALHGRRIAYSNVPVQEEITLRGVYGRTVDMTVTVRPTGPDLYQLFRVKVARGSQHYTSITYRPHTSTLSLSRLHSGSTKDFVHERECLVRNRGGEIKLRILLDRFSAEVFANDGEHVMTTTLYTPQTADGISFEANGQVLLTVEKYDIIR